MKRLQVFLIMTLVLGLPRIADSAPAVSAASGDAYARATALKDHGNRMLTDGRFDEALTAFTDAYAIVPSPTLFVSIGSAHLQLGRPTEAANYYQRYLDSGDTDADQRGAVEAMLGTLDLGLGRVEITVRGASQVELRTGTRWMPSMRWLRVAPGAFVIEARAFSGLKHLSRSGTVAAGAVEQVSFTFEAPFTDSPGASPPTADQPAAPNSGDSRPRHPRLFYGLVGAAGALTLTGAYLAIRAGHEQDLADAICPDRSQCPGTAARADAHHRRAVRFAQFSVATFVGAGLAAAGATYLWWRDRSASRQVAVTATPDGAAVVYADSF